MSLHPRGKEPACPLQHAGCAGIVRERSAVSCDSCHRAQRKIDAENRARARLEIQPEAQPQPLEPLVSFEEAWRLWQQCIGMAKDRYKRPSRFANLERQKILVIPDIHAPFHEPQMLADMLEAEKDADLAICIGDVGDSYALSRFVKYDWMPFRDEWAQVTLVMQAIASTFPEVRVIVGNHDSRLEKQLRTHLSQDMVDAISFMTGGTLCPLTALSRRYPNVSIARHEVPGGHVIDWFTTIGDAWLGHPERFSKVPGAALRQVEDWILDQERVLGLDRFRLLILGHTHQLSMIPWRSDQMLVECGCLCQLQGYMTSARIGGRPQKRGYITFEQENGVTDLNSVRMRWFDVEARAA